MAGVRTGLQRLICFGTSIGDDIIDITVQYPAEVVDGGGVQGLVFTELVDGGAGEVVVLDQGVGGLAGCAERFPEGSVDDHGVPPEPFSFMVCGGLFFDYSR